MPYTHKSHGTLQVGLALALYLSEMFSDLSELPRDASGVDAVVDIVPSSCYCTSNFKLSLRAASASPNAFLPHVGSDGSTPSVSLNF